MQDPEPLNLVGLRAGGPRPQIDGPVLVNEMTMSDSEFYVNDDEIVTVVYRRRDDGIMFEDNCSEGIWLELLEENARDID